MKRVVREPVLALPSIILTGRSSESSKVRMLLFFIVQLVIVEVCFFFCPLLYICMGSLYSSTAVQNSVDKVENGESYAEKKFEIL